MKLHLLQPKQERLTSVNSIITLALAVHKPLCDNNCNFVKQQLTIIFLFFISFVALQFIFVNPLEFLVFKKTTIYNKLLLTLIIMHLEIIQCSVKGNLM